MIKINDFKRLEVDGITQIGGVCTGLSYTLGVRAWFLQILFVIFLFSSGGVALIVYFLLCLFVPKENMSVEEYEKAFQESN